MRIIVTEGTEQTPRLKTLKRALTGRKVTDLKSIRI